MAKIREQDASIPAEQQITSRPTIPVALDAQVDRVVSSKPTKPEKSVSNGPVAETTKSVKSGSAAKRKQSKIRMDSDEESDSEPIMKRPKTDDAQLSKDKIKDEEEEETLLKLDPPKVNSVKPASSNAPKIKKMNANAQQSPKVKSPKINRAVNSESSNKAADDSSDSDEPLKKPTNGKRKRTVSPKVNRKTKTEDLSDSASASDEPLKESRKKQVKRSTMSKPVPKRKVANDSSDLSDAPDSDEDKKPLKKRSTIPVPPKIAKVSAKDTAKIAKKVDGKKTKATIKKEGDDDREDDEEEEYRWWEQQEQDDSVKWKTLEHNGVVFPDPYQRLPKDVKMRYNGRPLELTAEAEEVAGFFGALIESDHAENPTFVKNFFEDFQAVCKSSGMAKDSIPQDFKKCDFRPMFEYFEARKQEKKAISKEEKKRLKEEKDAFEEKYKEAIVDGRKEKIGNFRIEPPGLFRGRGAHPKTGRLKTRVLPEQVTINIGENVPVPAPPEGHKWADVKHDNTVTWLATWNENINNNVKYVMMAAGSSFKGQSDLKKYEKARTLKGCIKDIRKTYEAELSDKVMETRQRATAMYFIDKFALRAGNEKGEDEADTVGCCSLRCEHVSLKPPQTVIFDFLGKDSIRYYNEVVVELKVFKNLMIFKKSKNDEDKIFDRLDTTKLNKHLTSLMSGLSAKVFRTFNASFTFQEQLKQTDANATVADKVLAYNRANREVAILCNHQRTVSKTHDTAMEKIEDKVKEQKYQKMRLQRMMINLDTKLAKKRPELLEYESDIDDEWISEHHDVLYERELEKIKKKFDRENEKLSSNGEKVLPTTELNERLKAAEELKAQLKQEKKSKKVEAKGSMTIERLEAQIKKAKERILVTKTQMIDKDENKATALGTSKINYIDPRLTFAWCAKHNVPVEKMFTKTLREKFKWAAETPADWIF